jgi:hypothetical protein
VLMQLIASSMGGYLAGRLRTKWANVHTHEVYFRDTAHGFLVWAVGLVITAVFLTSTAASMIGGTARAGTTLHEDIGSAQSGTDSNGLILANGLRQRGIPPSDKSYLAQIVAAKTGVSEPDAEKRVDEAYAQAQRAADTTRKALAHSMYWTFLAFLIGAFFASFAATIGGKQRDRVLVV